MRAADVNAMLSSCRHTAPAMDGRRAILHGGLAHCAQVPRLDVLCLLVPFIINVNGCGSTSSANF